MIRRPLAGACALRLFLCPRIGENDGFQTKYAKLPLFFLAYICLGAKVNAGFLFCYCIFVKISLAFFPHRGYNRSIPGYILQTTAQGRAPTNGGMLRRMMQDEGMIDAGG